MLKVSYCDQAVSVVHALCVVNIYLVHPLEATVLFQSSWNFIRMFVLLISRPSLNMGHVRSKVSLGQISLNIVHPLEVTVLLQLSWNFTRMFVLMLSLLSLNMGHVRSKTSTLGQISLKPFSPSRGHSFASIFMKLYKNICLDDISVVWIWVMLDQNIGHQVRLL